MIQRLATLPKLLAAIATLAVAACSSPPEEKAGDPQTPPNPLFYEIANADGDVEGWMLGTIHALPDGTEWRTPAIDEAVGQADSLIVEVAELGHASIGQTFVSLATTPDLGPISLRVNRELRAPLDEMVELSEIPHSSFHDTETWAVAILLARVGAVGDPSNGVDRYMIEQFDPNAVVALETARGQLGVFDALSDEDQRKLLEGTVEEWLASRDNPGRLTQAWREGDEAALLEATSKGIMADAEIRDALLVNRNNAWLPVITESLAQTSKPLIAVGTAHLIGPDGLKVMLEAEGYTVTRISN